MREGDRQVPIALEQPARVDDRHTPITWPSAS
jgi:hypothetical protein